MNTRRDMAFLLAGWAMAHLGQDIPAGNAYGVMATVLTVAIMGLLVWALTGWKVSRRDKPL